MEAWVYRALAKWPNVPALYGWLKLDRRGRWLIKGELISRAQIIDVINANYAVDERGCWYFQNGPQRGYVALEYAPLVLRSQGEALVTHTGATVREPSAIYMDEAGALIFATEHGPGALIDDELEWALTRLWTDGAPVTEEQVAETLALPSCSPTGMELRLADRALPVQRLDVADAPAKLGFVRDPLSTVPSKSA